MEWFDKIKGFLGFSNKQEGPSINDQSRHWTPQPPDRSSDEIQQPFHGSFRNFSMFTDPFEIHRYFEQQMSEMLKNFGFHEFGDSFSNFGFSEERFEFPQIEELPEKHASPEDLRNQYLKPGYEQPCNQLNDKKEDGDIDGRLDIKDWDSVFRGENSVIPYQNQITPKTQFFGRSVSTKTLRNSDGSVETHHIVRDNEGNEETTIKRQIGDKEYTITKRRNKYGKEEIIEDLVNLDEKDKDKIFPQKPDGVHDLDQHNWSLFDRFFK